MLEHEVELHRKIAFPFVTLVMTFIAVPFAVTTGRRGAMYGIGIGIVLALVYWTMISCVCGVWRGRPDQSDAGGVGAEPVVRRRGRVSAAHSPDRDDRHSPAGALARIPWTPGTQIVPARPLGVVSLVPSLVVIPRASSCSSPTCRRAFPDARGKALSVLTAGGIDGARDCAAHLGVSGRYGVRERRAGFLGGPPFRRERGAAAAGEVREHRWRSAQPAIVLDPTYHPSPNRLQDQIGGHLPQVRHVVDQPFRAARLPQR